MTNKNQGKSGSQKDREEYGYGYDRSVEDLKVIGQNENAKNSNDERNDKKK